MRSKGVVLAVGAVVCLTGCTALVQVPKPVPPSALSASPLPSLETSDYPSTQEVLISGVLEIQPEGCVTVAGVRTLWPTGTKLVHNSEGSDIWLVDAAGKQRGKVGEEIKVGGGPLGPAENPTTGCQGNQQFGVNSF